MCSPTVGSPYPPLTSGNHLGPNALQPRLQFLKQQQLQGNDLLVIDCSWCWHFVHQMSRALIFKINSKALQLLSLKAVTQKRQNSLSQTKWGELLFIKIRLSHNEKIKNQAQNSLIHGRVRKRLINQQNYPLSGGGAVRGYFPLKTKQAKNLGLKQWILPNNQFTTNFFSMFGWILVLRVVQTLKALQRSRQQVSEIP